MTPADSLKKTPARSQRPWVALWVEEFWFPELLWVKQLKHHTRTGKRRGYSWWRPRFFQVEPLTTIHSRFVWVWRLRGSQRSDFSKFQPLASSSLLIPSFTSVPRPLATWIAPALGSCVGSARIGLPQANWAELLEPELATQPPGFSFPAKRWNSQSASLAASLTCRDDFARQTAYFNKLAGKFRWAAKEYFVSLKNENKP